MGRAISVQSQCHHPIAHNILVIKLSVSREYKRVFFNGNIQPSNIAFFSHAKRTTVNKNQSTQQDFLGAFYSAGTIRAKMDKGLCLLFTQCGYHTTGILSSIQIKDWPLHDVNPDLIFFYQIRRTNSLSRRASLPNSSIKSPKHTTCHQKIVGPVEPTRLS